MGFTTIYDNVIFDEGNRIDTKIKGEVEVDLSFKFGAQLKNLRDVKSALATKAKNLGANCIINFTYGQKSRLFAMDDVAFWGKGIACNITQDEFTKIIQKINER